MFVSTEVSVGRGASILMCLYCERLQSKSNLCCCIGIFSNGNPLFCQICLLNVGLRSTRANHFMHMPEI